MYVLLMYRLWKILLSNMSRSEAFGMVLVCLYLCSESASEGMKLRACCCCSWSCSKRGAVSNGDDVGPGRSWAWSSLWHIVFERMLCGVPVINLQLLWSFQLPFVGWVAATATAVGVSNGGVDVGQPAPDGPWDVRWTGLRQTPSVWWWL